MIRSSCYIAQFLLLAQIAQAQEIIRIPVVVHIVYNNDTQNISNGQIAGQINTLNADYRRTNADAMNTVEAFDNLATDTNVEFYLAGIDAAGLSTTGITRTHTDHGVFADDDIHFSAKGGMDAWNTTEYLNIWVCDLPAGIQGFASTATSVGAATDGVVIDYESFGNIGTAKSPYDLGRTLTHEVGHYLGLQHTWGTVGGCDDDDGIDDTPLQSAAVQECSTSTISCGSLDMVQNFMNTAPDNCLNFFTAGQSNRIREILLSVRAELVNDDKGQTITGISHTCHPTVIYPNPSADGKFFLSSTAVDSFEIFDRSGRAVSYDLINDDSRWQVQLNQQGSYIIQTHKDHKLETFKIIYE